MTSNNITRTEIKISIDGDVISLSFDGEFGKVSLSLCLSDLEAQLSLIISSLVERFEQNDPSVLEEIAKDSGVSIEEVRKSLKGIAFRKRAKPTRSAMDVFIGGRDLHFQGLVEQVIDNLPEGVELMLRHLAIAAIARTIPDLRKRRTSKPLTADNELLDLISPHFKRAINQLWERS